MSHWWQQRDYYDARIPHFQEHAVKEEPPTDDTASSSENDDDSASGYSSSASESSEETDSEEDIKNMSGAGEAMNDADRRVIARYIASLGIEWESMTYRDRWEPIQLLVSVTNIKRHLAIDDSSKVPSTKLEGLGPNRCQPL